VVGVEDLVVVGALPVDDVLHVLGARLLREHLDHLLLQARKGQLTQQTHLPLRAQHHHVLAQPDHHTRHTAHTAHAA
jgi:hypothetical protein